MFSAPKKHIHVGTIFVRCTTVSDHFPTQFSLGVQCPTVFSAPFFKRELVGPVKGIRVHSSPNQFRFPSLHRHQKFAQTRHVPQQPKFRLILCQRGLRFKHPIAQGFDFRRWPLHVSGDQGVPTLVQQTFEKDTSGGIFPHFNLLRLPKHKQCFGTGPSHPRQIIQGRGTGVLGAGVVQLHRRRHLVQRAVVLAHHGAQRVTT